MFFVCLFVFCTILFSRLLFDISILRLRFKSRFLFYDADRFFFQEYLFSCVILYLSPIPKAWISRYDAFLVGLCRSLILCPTTIVYKEIKNKILVTGLKWI